MVVTMNPEAVAREIAQKVSAAIEEVLIAALTESLGEAKKALAADVEKDLKKMRDWVRSAPIPVSVPFALTTEEKPGTDSRGYATRGAVPQAIADVLKAHPGIKTAGIMKLVRAANPVISEKSIANDLSRGKAKRRYRREADGGWFI